jgi:hypothetical protein
MSRTRKQIEAIAQLTACEIASYRKLDALADDAVGMDEISKHSCYTNGVDSCREIGVTFENGFSQAEIDTATQRFIVSTAICNELI